MLIYPYGSCPVLDNSARVICVLQILVDRSSPSVERLLCNGGILALLSMTIPRQRKINKMLLNHKGTMQRAHNVFSVDEMMEM